MNITDEEIKALIRKQRALGDHDCSFALSQFLHERNNRVLTCVYCGKEYPVGTPAHGAEILTEHIKVCPKHPMRERERLLRIAFDMIPESYSDTRDYQMLQRVLEGGTIPPPEDTLLLDWLQLPHRPETYLDLLGERDLRAAIREKMKEAR